MMRSAGMSAITARTSSAALKVAMPETENQAPSAAARRGQLRAGGVAVHQELERAARVLGPPGSRAIVVVGLARVDHQRQAGSPRGLDVDAEHRGLHFARAEVVVEVEARLADPDHLRPLGQVA